MANPIAFPGPPALGRGVVIEPGGDLPAPASDWPTLTVDAETLADPVAAIARLDGWWRERLPAVVVLGVPFAELKAPEKDETAPYLLDPSFEFGRERLHFLTWINRYDGRGDELRWHHAERALTLGAEPCPDGSGDVVVSGHPVWVDGGPRTSRDDDLSVVHVESVWSGALDPDRSPPPHSDLAPDQLAAVSDPGGPARIIAPAGSGKTRVLTERMRHLLVDRGWNPEVVTALAYNRRAAEEMTQRLGATGHVRTLHAFGYEILGRANGGRPRLLGEREVRRLLDRLAPIRPRANEDVHAPYIEALAEIRTALRPPDEVEGERDDVPGLGAFFDEYRALMYAQGAVDHDEQIYGAVEAMLRNPSLRTWAQGRCRHLLVDEFQDLTPAHLLMVRLLAAPAYDVFGVGDDDQVIYGYAGATPHFLIDYHDYFPSAAHHQLEVNYRCPDPVVKAASTLLSHNRRRVPKEIRSASRATSGLDVVRGSEAAIGGRLVEVVAGLLERTDPASVAVLARVNVSLLVPQVSLAEAGIPVDPALDDGLLNRSGVRSALAWLRLGSSAAHEEPMSGADLTEATRRPPRGLSPGVRNALGRGSWTLERLASFADGSSDDRTRTRLAGLVEDIFALGAQVSDGEPVSAQLGFVRDRLGLGAVLDRLDNSRARPTGGHTDDLDALVVLAHTHPEIQAFEPWLRAALQPRSDAGRVPVTLSTVHRVKGLEWPHVVVWDASTGLMPHRLAQDIEEERRIFHVAITRCSESVTVIARQDATSPFIGQLERTAPPETPSRPEPKGVEARIGLELAWQGFEATVVDLEDGAAVITVGTASRMRVAFGDPVTIDGVRARLVAPPAPAMDADVLERLRHWRRDRAARDGVPPYVVAHDAHLEAIARRRPADRGELSGCDGIGPTRLDKYGDEILAALAPES